jgi:hypothetical protein
MRNGRLIACVSAVLLAVGAVAAALALGASKPERAGVQRPLTLGFSDFTAFYSSGAAAQVWYQRAQYSGATVIRIDAGWAQIAPKEPTNPTNPADPAYQWGTLDSQVSEAVANGFTPVVTLTGAPTWALGPNAPTNAGEGAWEPNAAAYEQFAEAVGTRYSGSYPDPASPGTNLPEVTYWEPWNEPNLSLYLAPQWKRSGHSWVAESPVLYRNLLNAFYTGITTTLPQAQIIAGGTAPFGDPPGGQRIAPVVFDRDFMCLSGSALKPTSCPDPPHFDILDHHPYSISGPYVPALDTNDVSIADMGKLSRVLAKAERTGRALPAGPKPLWTLEVSWDSDPPNPQGVPMKEFARWVEETLYELWSEGVSTVSWFLIEDQAPIPNYASTYQSGMYFLNGQPKLSEQAYRFPLVIDTRKAHDMILWARVPVAGTLVVTQTRGGSTKQILSVTVSADQVVESKIKNGSGTFQATVGGQSSLEWPP